MAKQLQAISLAKLGFNGINTQQASSVQDVGFALQAENCLIDKYGRIGARKGWAYRTTEKDAAPGANIGIGLKGVHRFVEVVGSKTYLSWNGTNIFKGYSDLTTLTPTAGSSAANWKAVTLNDRVYFFSKTASPMYYTNESTSDELDLVTNHSDYTGTVPQGDIVMSAYGRLWVADTSANKTTLYFSNLLNGAQWGSGSAGSLDISGVLPNNLGQITGLGTHNGYLIIFCSNAIVIYRDGDTLTGHFDVASLQLVEVIEGVGCLSQCTIQNTGEDIIFLSATGVRTLGRTIQEKSQPMNNLSQNMHDDLMNDVTQESTSANIKAVFSPINSFYLLYIPAVNKVYCFDTRTRLPDGSLRITIWTGQTQHCMLYVEDTKELLFAQDDGIALYSGYFDNEALYAMKYYSTYLSLGAPTTEKALKRIGITLIGSTGQEFIVKLAVDYGTVFDSYPLVLQAGRPFYYNEHEFDGLWNDSATYLVDDSVVHSGSLWTCLVENTDSEPNSGNTDWANVGNLSDDASTIAQYSGGVIIETLRASVGGYGSILQIGFETNISGAPLSLQTLDLFLKTGRMV